MKQSEQKYAEKIAKKKSAAENRAQRKGSKSAKELKEREKDQRWENLKREFQVEQTSVST
jgi:hypothetical protein